MTNSVFTTSIRHPNEFSIVTGKTTLAREISSIEQSIRLLLTTAKGELFGDPDFGCNLYSYLYEYEGDILNQLIKDDIVKTLSEQETRVSVNPSGITIVEEDKTLSITISYNINYTDYTGEYFLIVSKRKEEEF